MPVLVSANLQLNFLTLLRINSVKYVRLRSSYLLFTGRYGSGSDETQPVKQHSQGGALGMGLLTGPAAVHYSLLVAK